MTEENKLFPGRPNYTGPTKGWFGLLHHEVLFEESHDVMERVEYVKNHKPKNEIAIRLHNMIYIDPAVCDAPAKRAPLDADYKAKRFALYADYEAKRAPLDADYEAKRDALDTDYEAKRDALYAEVLAYIKKHIHDCAWNGEELDFK